MKERIDSLLSSSVEIENSARKLNVQIERLLRQSPIMDSQKEEKLNRFCVSFEKNIDSLKDPFSRFENATEGLNKSAQLLSEKDEIINELQLLLGKKQQQRANLQRENNHYKQFYEEQRKIINRLQQRQIRYKMIKQKLSFIKIALQQLKQSHINTKNQVTSIFLSLNKEIAHSIKAIQEAISRQAKSQINASSFIAEKDSEVSKQKQKYRLLQDQFYNACYALSEATDNRLPESNSFSKGSEEFMANVINSIHALRFLGESKIVEQQQGKLWLMEKLRNFTKCDKKISSRLFYQYDPLSKTNFHNYIDGVPNLLVIAELENGYKIGGFTIYPFSKGPMIGKQRQSEGFLFNLLERMSFDSKPLSGFRVTNYDEYFLIFGNGEFRIKSGQLELFSNFGISNSTFASGSTTRNQFMGQTDRQNIYKLRNYEIHQIWA